MDHESMYEQMVASVSRWKRLFTPRPFTTNVPKSWLVPANVNVSVDGKSTWDSYSGKAVHTTTTQRTCTAQHTQTLPSHSSTSPMQQQAHVQHEVRAHTSTISTSARTNNQSTDSHRAQHSNERNNNKNNNNQHYNNNNNDNYSHSNNNDRSRVEKQHSTARTRDDRDDNDHDHDRRQQLNKQQQHDQPQSQEQSCVGNGSLGTLGNEVGTQLYFNVLKPWHDHCTGG